MRGLAAFQLTQESWVNEAGELHLVGGSALAARYGRAGLSDHAFSKMRRIASARVTPPAFARPSIFESSAGVSVRVTVILSVLPDADIPNFGVNLLPPSFSIGRYPRSFARAALERPPPGYSTTGEPRLHAS